MKLRKRIALAAAVLFVSACSGEPQPNAAPEPTPPAEPVAEAKAATQPLPQFVNLGADRCVPCRKMIPVRKAIAEDYAGQIEVSFIDVWKDRSAGEKYKPRIIPTQILLDAQGKELFRHEGYWPKEAIVAKFQELGITLARNDEDQP